MANQEHLDILNQGVAAWNKWRKEHLAGIHPDLSGVELRSANLEKIELINTDLRGTNLSEANLREAVLEDANFSGANLNGANLYGTMHYDSILSRANLRDAELVAAELLGSDFSGADLSRANFEGAVFYNANLSGADLTEADLHFAQLIETNLSQTKFKNTTIGETFFADVDLSKAKELDTVEHSSPSHISINTIYRSQGYIPESFLKGAGVDDTFITYIRSLVGKPIEYYSCFISYSSKDDAFARRLHADLQSNNVRCWFAPEDLKWGERIRRGIDEAIRLHDKLLLILSKSSVASGWVEREVKAALAKERKEKRTVLFPVRVDNAVFESPFDWATEIRHERNIGDFTRWKDHDDFEKAFRRLLRDLKAEAQKM